MCLFLYGCDHNMWSIFQHIWLNLMRKWPKMNRNYTANMIMNVSGIVWQRIHYFSSKQGLAINLLWPALKSKQHTCIELFDIISLQLPGVSFEHRHCDWLNHTTWFHSNRYNHSSALKHGIWVNIASFLCTIQTPICYVGCLMIANTWTDIFLYIRNTAILENNKSVCIFLHQLVNTCDRKMFTQSQ